MKNNIIRLLVNRDFLVVDVAVLASFYRSFSMRDIMKKAEIKVSAFEGTELGDFDLQGKMSYSLTKPEKLKLTYLDEKALLFKSKDSENLFKKLLAPGIINTEKMSETADEDWFGEKLYYGMYGRSTINFITGNVRCNSPILIRSLLEKDEIFSDNIVSTGGCSFDHFQGKKILDLSRTPENHLFVEDEENLLLGSGLSPFTTKHLLRNQYPRLDSILDAIREPYYHSSSLWDICCYHTSGALLIKELVSLKTKVSIRNDKGSVNISPALLNNLTTGLPLYFLISKKPKYFKI